jgi:hypothetical protein
MFERFTVAARLAVVEAREQALSRRADRIGSEHVLLALFSGPENLAVTVLAAFGVDRTAVEEAVGSGPSEGAADLDAEALATLGIDLDEVRRQVEQAFGPGALDRAGAAGGRRRGHLPFDRTARKALGLALREAIRMEHNYIGTEHIVLGLMQAGGPAGTLLADRGMRLDAARVLVEELVRGRRAG